MARGLRRMATVALEGCEAVLALADIKTTHSAFPADEGYGYRRRGWYGDYDEDDDEYSGAARDSEREYDFRIWSTPSQTGRRLLCCHRAGLSPFLALR